MHLVCRDGAFLQIRSQVISSKYLLDLAGKREASCLSLVIVSWHGAGIQFRYWYPWLVKLSFNGNSIILKNGEISGVGFYRNISNEPSI